MSAITRPFSKFLANTSPLAQLLWLGLLGVMIAAQLLGLNSEWRYDRALIEAGQWYRLISAHFIHLNVKHLLLNLAALILVLVFFSNHLKAWQWLALLLFSSLMVSAGLYFFDPGLKRYVGFSGVVHGLFLAGALVETRRFPLSGWILVLVLVAKLVWEQLYGALPGSASLISGRVVVDAHLYGAISGVLFLVLFNIRYIRRWLR